MRILLWPGALLLAVGLAVPVSAQDAKKEVKTKVTEGQPAPDVELPAANAEKGKALKLKDYQGKKNVVLFFYPKAATRGWTIEACAFRDRQEQFAQLDTVTIGISVDNLQAQEDFAKKENLTYPLLADSEKKVAQTFGVLAANGFAQRMTFVIDKQGTVKKVYTQVKPAEHADEVLKYVKENLAKGS